MNTQKIEWLLANPDFYKDTEQADKVLSPDENVKWFFQQHGVKILERINTQNEKKIRITLFDNHTANRRPVDYFDDVKSSYVMVYTINELDNTVTMDKRIPVPLSITRSNVEYFKESNQIYAMCANIKDDSISCRAKIIGFDYNTEERIYEASCINDFFVAKFMDFDLTTVKNSTIEDKAVCLGELYSPEKIDKLPDELKNAPVFPDEMRKSAHFNLWGNIIQINCKDHTVQKIYLYNNENIYVMDYEDTKQLTKIFKEHVYLISIPLNNMEKGKYDISIKYEDEFYKMAYWVEIK